ncbi:MAG: Fic family protein [Bacteroidales bacterium]|nr:Fic family protein [Bacteroidales bacterium]
MGDTLQNKLKECDRLQQQLWGYRPLGAETLKSLKDYYRIGLTFTSNAIEGNSLTESETKVVVEDGLTVEGKPLKDLYEATGHASAFDFVYSLAKDKPLEESDILTIHKLFYEKIDVSKAGIYRKVPVFISGSKYAVSPVDKIENRISKLVDWYNNNENKIHPVILAAQMHKRFVFIHPFIDGNGRLARLLMNLALMRNDYNIAIIPQIMRSEYISVLERAHSNDTPFTVFIADRVIATQSDILRLFSETIPQPDILPLEQMLQDTILNNPGINAPALALKLARSLRTIQRYLRTLSQNGIIEFRGVAKKGGYYIK